MAQRPSFQLAVYRMRFVASKSSRDIDDAAA